MPYCSSGHVYYGATCDTCAWSQPRGSSSTGWPPTGERSEGRFVGRGTTGGGASARPARRWGWRTVTIVSTPECAERHAGLAPIWWWGVKVMIAAFAIYMLATRWWPTAVGFFAQHLFVTVVVGVVAWRLLRRGGNMLTGPLGFSLWRAAFGQPRSVPSIPFHVTTFRGDDAGRSRGYQISSWHRPVVQHGDTVEVLGVRGFGRLQVLVLRAPTGLTLRRGLISRPFTLLAAICFLWWLTS